MKSEAMQLAGELLEIPRRVAILHNLYLDSRGNHAFSLIAAHGALWAWNYFETGGRLGRLMTYRVLQGLLRDRRTHHARNVCVPTGSGSWVGTSPGKHESISRDARELL